MGIGDGVGNGCSYMVFFTERWVEEVFSSDTLLSIMMEGDEVLGNGRWTEKVFPSDTPLPKSRKF